MKNEVKDSRYLSYLLRHHPKDIDLTIDKNGWVLIKELIEKSKNQFTKEYLEQIVKNDNKNRYSFDETKLKIRANQGHSIDIDLELKEETPPILLYHGTAEKYLDSIQTNGICKQSRNHVHLSSDIETAIKVGSRHGKVIIFKINTLKMIKDGYRFYISENGVWLTDNIPIQYIDKYEI